jgi:heptosyltransferase-2
MNIAIFLPNWVGDAVMATPALRALRGHFPQAKLIGILKPYIAGVLEGTPWLDEQVFLDSKGPWQHRWPAAARRLRQQKLEQAVLFSNTFRAAFVARLAGARRRIGFRRHGRGLLLNEAIEPVRGPDGKLKPSPVINAYNLLAQQAGCPFPGFRMELFTTPDDETAAQAVWRRGELARYPEIVCFNPGAAFGAAKHWSADYFAQLAQELVDRRGSGVLVLCGPAERELARRIAGLARRPAVITLADEPLSLGLTKACVRRADLLVTTDSGPRHFAAAFGTPVITLFGPTHIAWTETYYERALHLQKQVPCGPCQLRVCPLDHACMTQLLPAEVFAAATQLLTRFSRRVRTAS